MFECLSDYTRKYPSIKYQVSCKEARTGKIITMSSRGIGVLEEDIKSLSGQYLVESIHIIVPGGGLMSANFGEVLFLDGTYNTNRHGLPLIIASVEDGFGCTRIAQISLLTSECAESLSSALNFYKRNSGRISPKTVMIDKDCTERAAILSVFPEADILLCRFHVVKYLKEELPILALGIQQEKKAALHCLQQLIYTTSAEVYHETLQRFRSFTCVSKVRAEGGKKQSFLRYFIKNWHPEPIRNL